MAQAIQHWEAVNQRVGRGGNQAELHRQLLSAYGNAAPSREAVSKWARGDYVPSLDYCWMLSSIFGVRPAWLAFKDGPMTPRPAVDPETEAALEEAMKRHPAPATAADAPKRGKRAG